MAAAAMACEDYYCNRVSHAAIFFRFDLFYKEQRNTHGKQKYENRQKNIYNDYI
jgi:hypothetical protein